VKTITRFLVVTALAVGGMATAAWAADTAFTGEVWVWDEQTNTITLRQGGQDVRVKVNPDQFIGLRLHETKTIYGELAPAVELPLVTVEGQPPAVVPRGPADEREVIGIVAAVDPGGKISVNAPQGVVQVWRATGGLAFNFGARVRVRMRVQPLDLVPARPGQAGAAPPVAAVEPSASPRTGPGDYAVVMGRVLAVDPSGRLTVDSSRGPITVLVPTATRYRVNDTVEVRTSVHPIM
jgi:hypothetical protein